MSQPELLKRLVEVLQRLSIPYMVTGSVASSLQGEPRASHDIDLVVSIQPAQAPDLARAFPEPDFYLTEDSIQEGIRTGSMFNLLSIADGEKVDFWLLTDSPFDQSRFARRRVERFNGLELLVAAPEDTILMKLNWAKMYGGSMKQFTDALRVYELQGSKLDLEYLDFWARELQVEASWQQLQEQASIEGAS